MKLKFQLQWTLNNFIVVDYFWENLLKSEAEPAIHKVTYWLVTDVVALIIKKFIN